MSMRRDWIELLFERLSMRYGRAFATQYEGLDMGLIKADWSDVMDGITAERIRFALANLPPDTPPNAMRFRTLCMSMVADTADLARLPLEPAKPTPEQAEAIKAAISRVTAAPSNQLSPGRECMERLRTFEARTGRRLNPAQRFQLDALERMFAPPSPPIHDEYEVF